MRNAIIIGSEGQDGRLLRERLTKDGCTVLGIGRHGVQHSAGSTAAVDRTVGILDRTAVERTIKTFQPDAVFYLAAHHHSSEDERPSDDAELYLRSHDVHVRGLLNVLEALMRHAPKARIFYAASSHCFGEPPASIQDERTPLRPRDPYGISKTAGVELCRMYRMRHALGASCGFLYNHESPLRSPKFLSAKIVHGAVAISDGRLDRLVLGDLSARVDWGHAPDYIDAMIRIVELDKADDFVIATGESHSVEDFVSIAFAQVGIDWRKHVETRPSLLTRSSTRTALVGDSTKLRQTTGWAPSVTFAEMVRLLVEAERKRASRPASPAA